MTDATPQKTTKHPPKKFAIPADIRALGNYGVAITDAMRREHASRMSGSR